MRVRLQCERAGQQARRACVRVKARGVHAARAGSRAFGLSYLVSKKNKKRTPARTPDRGANPCDPLSPRAFPRGRSGGLRGGGAPPPGPVATSGSSLPIGVCLPFFWHRRELRGVGVSTWPPQVAVRPTLSLQARERPWAVPGPPSGWVEPSRHPFLGIKSKMF